VVLTTHYLEEAEELADRIGVIRDGRLLVVEETQALIARYSKRTVRLQLEQPLRELPAALQQSGAALADGGAAGVATQPVGEALAAPLQAIAASGLRVADVQTREPRLENVILELLRSKTPLVLPSGNGASAPERPVPPAPPPPPPQEPTLGPRTL